MPQLLAQAMQQTSRCLSARPSTPASSRTRSSRSSCATSRSLPIGARGQHLVPADDPAEPAGLGAAIREDRRAPTSGSSRRRMPRPCLRWTFDALALGPGSATRSAPPCETLGSSRRDRRRGAEPRASCRRTRHRLRRGAREAPARSRADQLGGHGIRIVVRRRRADLAVPRRRRGRSAPGWPLAAPIPSPPTRSSIEACLRRLIGALGRRRHPLAPDARRPPRRACRLVRQRIPIDGRDLGRGLPLVIRRHHS